MTIRAPAEIGMPLDEVDTPAPVTSTPSNAIRTVCRSGSRVAPCRFARMPRPANARSSALLPNKIETGFSERSNFALPGPRPYPSGAHLCEVEIDEETGKVALTHYEAVDDVGPVSNPLPCEGQIQVKSRPLVGS